MTRLARLLATTAFVAGLSGAAQASSFLVYKLGLDATGGNAVTDAYDSWANAGGFNEGNGTAMSLSNTTLDFKDSWVDSGANWATVTAVHVGFWSQGTEVASLDFNPGSDKLSFYAAGNRTASTFNDLGSFSGNFFSAAGDSGIGRNWFINQNYGGCAVDSGWTVVLDSNSSKPCSWETNNDNNTTGRAFLYATNGNGIENWNDSIGQADVFSISVSTDEVPEPASMALLGAGLAGMAALRRRRR